ncbi:Acylamino acid releasing enzyme [Operophtera brumata]|uniref:Acylamino acid releasing enzyme n=1 Tax=Operophtera brumata TaxID=104452 RepID=A0A0L7LDV1_OPEBR|nr:Acylamino acid releasing enzyme [Operophtera brumata]
MLSYFGSHGGFLVTLRGRYFYLYNAVVSRNPVTDVATVYNCTDINDCLWMGSFLTVSSI